MTDFFVGADVDAFTEKSLEHRSGANEAVTTAIAETFNRAGATTVATTLITTQGFYSAIQLAAGDVVSNITFWAVGASSSMTNQWAALYSGSRTGPLAISADATTTAISATAAVTYAMTTPYTVPVGGDGLYYVMLGIVGSGLATFAGTAGSPALNLKAPAVAFTDSGHTLSNPASAPATATASAGYNSLYAFVS